MNTDINKFKLKYLPEHSMYEYDNVQNEYI